MKKPGLGRTALVTGASAGIGVALARVFAKNGFDLALTARREDRLKTVAAELTNRFGVRASVIAADLADPKSPRRLFNTLCERGVVVDALVNNAGYAVPQAFRRTSWATHAAFMQVMVQAPVELCHLFEPGMLERGYGRILNVASLAGLVPGARGHTLYGAAKSFVIKFSESLALEHEGDGVQVSVLCPGFTYSEFHDVANVRGLVSKLPSYLWMDAEAVAEDGYEALMGGRLICVPGAVNRAIVSVARLLPESVALSAMKRQSKKIRAAD